MNSEINHDIFRKQRLYTRMFMAVMFPITLAIFAFAVHRTIPPATVHADEHPDWVFEYRGHYYDMPTALIDGIIDPKFLQPEQIIESPAKPEHASLQAAIDTLSEDRPLIVVYCPITGERSRVLQRRVTRPLCTNDWTKVGEFLFWHNFPLKRADLLFINSSDTHKLDVKEVLAKQLALTHDAQFGHIGTAPHPPAYRLPYRMIQVWENGQLVDGFEIRNNDWLIESVADTLAKVKG